MQQSAESRLRAADNFRAEFEAQGDDAYQEAYQQGYQDAERL